MITVIDYGLGNLASVANMIRKVGGTVRISSSCEDIASASKLILPGVGAFDHGVRQLHDLNIFSLIRERAGSGVPLLGICLGMQLLGSRSDEGTLRGLDLIDAEFCRFDFGGSGNYRVPHVGWNDVKVEKDNPLLPVGDDQLRFYFTHSFHALCRRSSDVMATTEYGYGFVSAYSHENVYGVQFHPEKSHRFGMALMRRFVELPC